LSKASRQPTTDKQVGTKLFRFKNDKNELPIVQWKERIMIECLSCQTSNSIDSQFCKGCGKALAQDLIGVALVEHEAFVAEGQKALAEGRIDEALLIAHSAVEQNPDSVPALSLRGVVYERQGRIVEALEAFERVVILNPNSSLDKIKVQQLRNSLSAQVLYTAQPDRSRAFIGAAAAVLLVVGAGAIFAVYVQRANVQLSDDAHGLAMRSGQPENGLINPDKASKPNPNSESGAGTSTADDSNKMKNPGDVGAIKNNVEGGVTNRGSGLPNGSGISLPPVGPGVGEIRPYPVGEPPTGINGGTATTNPNGNDPDPTIENPNGSKATAPIEKNSQDDPGVIEIKTSQKSPSNKSGGTDIDQGMSSKALSEAARTQFGTQKYDQAARSYERLLSMGGDPATVNQRLGQCYTNLGQTANAASAYKRAISAIEDRKKNSTGDTAYLDKLLESCRRALKVLGG
jgi:tetratricopeptide (TPR) repeat protein